MKKRRRIRNVQGRDYGKRRAPDPLSRQKRSALMARIRGRGTDFEEQFIKAFRAACLVRFERNSNRVLGKPDLVFRHQRTCVFLDSDFWHGWQFPRWRHLLKNDFWRDKIAVNRKRDRYVTRTLRGQGWRVFRFWEHDLRGKLPAAVGRIRQA
ncbi:MAG: hypothetical protein ACOYMV_12745, partial [Verrucomicrobiia bacterium]